MKKLLIPCFVFILSFSTVQAQNKNTQDHKISTKENSNFSDRNDKELENLDKQLSLSSSQKSKIREIMEEDYAKNKSTSSKSSKKQTNHANNKDERNSRIEEVLNSEQRNKYSEIKNKDSKEKGKNGTNKKNNRSNKNISNNKQKERNYREYMNRRMEG